MGDHKKANIARRSTWWSRLDFDSRCNNGSHLRPQLNTKSSARQLRHARNELRNLFVRKDEIHAWYLNEQRDQAVGTLVEPTGKAGPLKKIGRQDAVQRRQRCNNVRSFRALSSKKGELECALGRAADDGGKLVSPRPA